MTMLWLVTLYHGDDRTDLYQYGTVGIFETKEDALQACRTDQHSLGPLELNKDYRDARDIHIGAYYPHLETVEEGDARMRAYNAGDTTKERP